MYRKSIFSDDLDGNSSKNSEGTKSSNNAKFPWGGKMTPKRKATSPLSNSKVIAKSNASSLAFHKIDPQIYADTKSRGLVSRIVKYHENNQKTDKTSIRSVYNKPGQFPIVHLNQADMYNKTPRQIETLSRVNIASPDKLVCQVNSRLSILRNGNSAIFHEKIFKDNEPLAPTTDVEIIPTKSVLDALKEISRKRINSDDVDDDGNKKLCSETSSNDIIDYPEQNRLNNFVTKRQRDTQSSPNSKNNCSNEQIRQKKKLCTKNNDILSSLSSSVRLQQPLKKLNEQQPRGSQQESIVNISYVTKTKQQIDIPKIAKVKSDLNVTEELSKITNNESLNETNQIREQIIPKLTLFNRNYSKESELEGKKRVEKVHHDDINLENNISFIKPKQQTITSFNNEKDTISGVNKNKLSLMLSCLRGDVDGEDDDEEGVDVIDANKIKENNINKVSETKTAIDTGSIVTTTTLASLLKPNEITATTQSVDTFKPITFVGTPATTPSSTTISSQNTKENIKLPQFVAKPIVTTSVAPTPTTIQNNVTFDFTKSTSQNTIPPNVTITSVAQPAVTSPPRIGGFSFPLNVPNSNTTTVTTTTTSSVASATSIPSFGISNPVVSSTTSSTNSNFNFGNSKLSSTTTTPAVPVSVAPPKNITFGAGTKAAQAGTESSGSMFSFASNTTVKPIVAPVQPTELKQSFNFGQNQTTNMFPIAGAATTQIKNPETQLKEVAQASVTSPINTSFNFLNAQQPNPTTGINFGQKIATTDPAKSFNFSSNNIETQKTGNFNSGFAGINPLPSNNNNLTFNNGKTTSTTSPPMNLSTFGVQNNAVTTATNSSMFNFGTTSTTSGIVPSGSNELTFGSVAKTQNTIAAFGVANPVSTSSFNFLTSPVTTTQAVTVGGTNVIPFGTNQNQLQTSNDFTFGNSTQNPTTNSNIFSKPIQSVTSSNNSSFNFGGGQQNQLQAFGTDNQNNNSSVLQQQNKIPVFGGFTGTQQQQQQTTQSSSSSGIFSSSGQNQTSINSNQTNTNNLFNFGDNNKTGTTTGAPTAFQSNNNNSQFGKNDNLISFGTPETQQQNSSIFGFGRHQNSTGSGTVTTTSSSSASLFPFNNSNVSGNTFSNNAITSGPISTSSETLFGNNANGNNSTFAFGGTTTSNNNLPSFGSITNNNPPPQYGDTIKPFSFGGTPNNQNPFGGGNNNQNNLPSAVVSPFSSGGGNVVSVVGTEKPAFNFKFGQGQPNSSVQAGPMFNDNSAINNNNNAVPPYGTNSNPFSIGGSVNASTPRRPMRTATRRLK